MPNPITATLRAEAVTVRGAYEFGALQVFNVVPTLLEVTLVAGILAYKCGPSFAILTGATLTAYTAFTFAITSVSSAGHPTCRLLNLPA